MSDSADSKTLRVLVCGSRTYADEAKVHDVLSAINRVHGPIDTIIDGAATGADTLGWGWGYNSPGIKSERYAANWNLHGKAAGPIRNQQMLDEGKPDLVVAFVDKPLSQSRGTADMVCRSRAAGLRVIVHSEDEIDPLGSGAKVALHELLQRVAYSPIKAEPSE